MAKMPLFGIGMQNGVTPVMWGIRTSLGELLKTFCLALTLFASFYTLLFVSYGIFHTDFRFTFISAAASFPSKMWLVALEYIPPFFIFYLANSIRVNSASRFSGQCEYWIARINISPTELPSALMSRLTHSRCPSNRLALFTRMELAR